MKKLTWIADSRSRVKSFPDVVQDEVGYQKKSKAGIATPKPEIEVVRQRLRYLREEVRNAEN